MTGKEENSKNQYLTGGRREGRDREIETDGRQDIIRNKQVKGEGGRLNVKHTDIERGGGRLRVRDEEIKGMGVGVGTSKRKR